MHRTTMFLSPVSHAHAGGRSAAAPMNEAVLPDGAQGADEDLPGALFFFSINRNVPFESTIGQ